MLSRPLRALPVPAGPELRDLLPVLEQALAGRGPSWLPVPADDPTEAGRRVEAASLNLPLGPAEDDPRDPTVLVLSTSGSTGTPKGALLSAGALRASIAATAVRLPGRGRWLLALPAHHIAGLQVLLRSVAAGTEPVLLDLRGGFDPAAFAARTGELGSSRRYTSLVPTQLVRLLDHPAGLAALRSYDAVLVGGAAVAGPALAAARAAGVPVVTTYGGSETCGGCVYDGRPLDGVTVRVDPEGRVRLGGPVLARGYRGRPELTASSFVSGPAGREFRTDDLGELDADAVLRILGRADDVIVSGGLKIAPAAVEAALEGLPAIRECLVVGVPDEEWGARLVAVVVARDPSRPPALTELRAAVAAELSAAAAPRQLVLVDALPLRGPGKPDRRAAAALAVAARPV